MRTRRSVVAAVVLLAALGVAQDARAEVSAEIDASGNYIRTMVLSNASMRNLKIWAIQRGRILSYPLNVTGDANGDLWPFIAENPYDGNLPWVVWSRFTGAGYDLAWSRWRPGGWTGIQWVEDLPSVSGDDLDPDVAFGTDGRPHLVWWRNEGGIGRVYLSIYLVSRWMTAFLVSDLDVDSRMPTVTVLPNGRIEVVYDTPAGPIARIVTFSRPTTITDDIDPFGRMSLSPPAPDPSSNLSH